MRLHPASVLLIVCGCLTQIHAAAAYKTERGSQRFWNDVGADELKRNLKDSRIPTRAKNLVLFIGDGMSVATVTAARIFKAQQANDTRPGYRLLAFEEAPYVGLSKTYTDDFTIADSGATATAMLSGIKINSLTIGVDSRVQFKNCSSYSPETDVKNIFAYAIEAGLSTGLVTTTMLTHATPSAAYGHTVNRFWMSDADMMKEKESDRQRCPDLAAQFLTNAIDFNVALAGGSTKFLPEGNGGERKDKRNIIKEWEAEQKRRKRTYRFVDTKRKLRHAMNVTNLDRLLGIFSRDNFPFTDEMEKPENVEKPTLAEMVEVAVRVLSRSDKGFFLLVEGGRIDHAHHKSMARRALQEVLGLEEAYKTVQRLTRPEDTLMITTADHSHVFTIGGYAHRSTSILGFPKVDTEGLGPGKAADRLPFTILLYANGPGAPNRKARTDPSLKDTTSPTYQQQAAVPLKKETHGGDDVAVYARGPMAHLVGGVHEQNYLGHVLMYAGCLGPYRARGDCPSAGGSPRPASTATVLLSLVVALSACWRH